MGLACCYEGLRKAGIPEEALLDRELFSRKKPALDVIRRQHRFASRNVMNKKRSGFRLHTI
jgi:hypothetical protein